MASEEAIEAEVARHAAEKTKVDAAEEEEEEHAGAEEQVERSQGSDSVYLSTVLKAPSMRSRPVGEHHARPESSPQTLYSLVAAMTSSTRIADQTRSEMKNI